VQADDPRRLAEPRAELGERERRRVRREHRLFRRRGHHLAEERHLEIHVLGDGLDDEVGALARRRDVEHRMHARERGFGGLFRGLALRHQLLELRGDGLRGLLGAAREAVEEVHLDAVRGGDLCDALAHRPRAEHTGALHRCGRAHRRSYTRVGVPG